MKTKKDFLDAMRRVAGKSKVSEELIVFLEKTGVEVPLVHDETVFREVNSAEYDLIRKSREGTAEFLGTEFPKTHAEFIVLVQAANASEVPRFKIDLPEHWNLEEQIAVTAILPEVERKYLPGTSIACYNRKFSVGAMGVELHSHQIYFITSPCSELWMGLMGLHTVFVAKEAVNTPQSEEEDSFDLQIAQGLVQRKPVQRQKEDVLRLRRAYRFLGELIHEQCGNVFWPMLETHNPFSAPNPSFSLKEFLSLMKFLIPELFPACSDLESVCRDASILNVIYARLLPEEKYVQYFQQDRVWAKSYAVEGK